MNTAGLVVLVLVAALGAEGEASEPLTVTVIAASATKEGPVMAQKTPAYDGMVKSMLPQDRKKKGEKHFDPEIRGIETVVADLPYDTYRKVNVLTEKVNMNEEAEFPIDPKYTLYARPVEKDDQSRVKMDLRVDEKVEEDAASPSKDAQGDSASAESISGDKAPQEKKHVIQKALEITSSLAPGKPLRLLGLKLKEACLVVVLRIEPEPTP